MRQKYCNLPNMKRSIARNIEYDGGRLEFRVKTSDTAKQLRIRVGMDGVVVLRPADRKMGELDSFIEDNINWVQSQVARIERLRRIRSPQTTPPQSILFHGKLTPVEIERKPRRAGTNKVVSQDGRITVIRGACSQTLPEKSLEYWLRGQARKVIESLLPPLCTRLAVEPNRIYVRAQRTKWGNCSALGNLSFNWRLIMAPNYVQRYLVTHEMVHLKVPDHSTRFWLAVQGFCPEKERARQWLCANVENVFVDLNTICQSPVSIRER